MKYSSQQIDTMLNHPVIKNRMGRPVKINTDYDVPGLSGISKNGRTIYIDRHVRPRSKEIVNILKDYIITRKQLRQVFKVSPWQAKRISSHKLLPYAETLIPQIKVIKSPKIRLIPPDLDLSLYRPGHAKLRKKTLRRADRRRKAIDKYNETRYTKQIKESNNVDRDIYSSRLPR